MNKKKIAIYNAAKEICKTIQAKIDSELYVILYDWEILNNLRNFKPAFILNDVDHSIELQHSLHCFSAIISSDDFEDSFTSIKEMKEFFLDKFMFVPLEKFRKYNGRK